MSSVSPHPPTLAVQRLHPEAVLPKRQHPGDAGLDLCCLEPIHLEPGERGMIQTGIAVAIPLGYAGLVVPRSGLAARHGITVVNGPGTIDAGYRGELQVLLLNTDREEPFLASSGERIAQLLLVPIALSSVELVSTLDDTARGGGGFGSTGR